MFSNTEKVSIVSMNSIKAIKQLGVCTTFNLYWDNIINLIYSLVKVANFSMQDILNSEFWFAMALYDKLTDEIKEQRKQQEEQNKREQQEYNKYQQMYQQNYGDMNFNNMFNGNGTNFNNMTQ